MQFVIVIFVIDIFFITSLTSNEAWNLIVKDYSEGKMLNESKDFFIFQEENYTQLDINDEKMKEIYEKQIEMYYLCGIRSYIFAINNRSQMDISNFRSNMRDNMKSWGINVNNSVFTVVMVNENDSIVYTGSIIKQLYIPDSTARVIKATLLDNMSHKEYYTAWKTFIYDIYNICYGIFEELNNTFHNSTNYNHYSGVRHGGGSGSVSLWVRIVACIGAVLVLGGIIIACWKCRCCEKLNNIKSSNIYDHDTYSARSYGGNNDVSVGGHSTGGNSVGGRSIGRNDDNDGCSGGA